MPEDLVVAARTLLAKAMAGTLTGHETDMLRRAGSPPGPDGRPADPTTVHGQAAQLIAEHFDADGRSRRGVAP